MISPPQNVSATGHMRIRRMLCFVAVFIAASVGAALVLLVLVIRTSLGRDIVSYVKEDFVGIMGLHPDELNETIEEGSAYGFTIGDTKAECFQKAEQLIRNHSAFLHPGPEEAELLRSYGIDARSNQQIERVEQAFPDWRDWVLTDSDAKTPEPVTLVFGVHTSALEHIYVGGMLSFREVPVWPEDGAQQSSLVPGLDYGEVYRRLRIREEESQSDTLHLRAKSWRIVSTFDEASYQRLSKWDVWIIRYQYAPWNDFASLSFAEGRLKTIWRLKQYIGTD